MVYNSFLDNGNGKPLDKAVQQFLLDSGIVTVVSGHQPHGDCPFAMKPAKRPSSRPTPRTARWVQTAGGARQSRR